MLQIIRILERGYPTFFRVGRIFAKALERRPSRCIACGAELGQEVITCRRCHLEGTPIRSKEAGLALVVTMIFLVFVAGLTVAAFNTAMTTTRTSASYVWDAEAFYIAEGGAESALSELLLGMEDGVIDSAELANIAPPDELLDRGWIFPRFDARLVDTLSIETITDGPYAGMFALTQPVEVNVRSMNAAGASSSVQLTAKAQAIPIFQFGVFFEGDLEATNGPPLTFDGRVHSNGNIYLDSDNAWYRDYITTPASIYRDRKDFHSLDAGVWIADGAAVDVLLTFDSRTIPDGETFKARSELDFDGRVQTGASYGVGPLRVPLPEGMDPYEIIRPREDDDTELERRAKYAWTSDWYIDIDVNGLGAVGENICQEIQANSARAAGIVPTVVACQAADIFRFTFEAFYDGREERTVDVLDIDINALRGWIEAGAANRNVRTFYITFHGVGVVDPSADGTFPVVRLVNGAELWGPITFATDHPLYVQKDYNVVAWKPAAIAADALTILSESWSDSNAPMSSAGATTVNLAIMAGQVATPCDHEAAGCPGGYADFYSGGIENFPRFIEDWTGVPLTYRGSLISLYESQRAVGTWNGSYYGAPVRDWGFDLAFQNPANLPPGTPVVGFILATSFRPVD